MEEFHSGKEKVLGFLVGQVMKKMRGKADPGMSTNCFGKNYKNVKKRKERNNNHAKVK